MGGFLGIGGSSAKTDRNQVTSGFGQLNNLFNFGMNTSQKGVAAGGSTQQAGLSGLSDANSYFKNLASGNRTAVQQAAAPEINMVQNQADAERRNQVASGTSRGGGVAGANQQQKTDTMSKIDNALFGVRPAAAQAEASTSGKIADVGSTQMEQALQALGLSTTAASDNLFGAIKSREDSYGINRQAQKDVIGVLQNAMKAFS